MKDVQDLYTGNYKATKYFWEKIRTYMQGLGVGEEDTKSDNYEKSDNHEREIGLH